MVLGQVDIYMQNDEIGTLSHIYIYIQNVSESYTEGRTEVDTNR